MKLPRKKGYIYIYIYIYIYMTLTDEDSDLVRYWSQSDIKWWKGGITLLNIFLVKFAYEQFFPPFSQSFHFLFFFFQFNVINMSPVPIIFLLITGPFILLSSTRSIGYYILIDFNGMSTQWSYFMLWGQGIVFIVRSYLQLFGLVLWHINHSRLFNANSSLYVYIKYRICKHVL